MFLSWVEPWVTCLFQIHAERMKKVYHPLRAALSFHSKVSVGHLFAAREDLSKIHRTSSGKIREKTACPINKVNDNPIRFVFQKSFDSQNRVKKICRMSPQQNIGQLMASKAGFS